MKAEGDRPKAPVASYVADENFRVYYRLMQWEKYKLVYCVSRFERNPKYIIEEFKPENECRNVKFEKRTVYVNDRPETVTIPICRTLNNGEQ